jgi:type IV pilus assembly protein PilM
MYQPGKHKQAGGRPPVAVEISPEGILAAALPSSHRRRGGPEQIRTAVIAFAPLTAGALVPSIDEPNVRNAEAVSGAIRSALSQVSPSTHFVTLVLPDTLVRVFMLDFDSLPPKPAEALSVVRFRLRKSVPFDVEEAGLSYQVLTADKTGCKVLAAVLPGAILAEYEAAVRKAGYEPGAVLPAGLAALETADALESMLTVNLSAHAVTTCITQGQDLLLYRTLDLPQEPRQRAEDIRRGITVAAAYYEDMLGSRPRQLQYAGILTAAEFAERLGDPELSVVEWVPRPEEGAMTALPQISFAGVAGALAGAS